MEKGHPEEIPFSSELPLPAAGAPTNDKLSMRLDLRVVLLDKAEPVRL